MRTHSGRTGLWGGGWLINSFGSQRPGDLCVNAPCRPFGRPTVVVVVAVATVDAASAAWEQPRTGTN